MMETRAKRKTSKTTAQKPQKSTGQQDKSDTKHSMKGDSVDIISLFSFILFYVIAG